MPPAGFEPAITASERPQTHALDCAVTGISKKSPLSSIVTAYIRKLSLFAVKIIRSIQSKCIGKIQFIMYVEQLESISCFH
jgi:hypothetical protein